MASHAALSFLGERVGGHLHDPCAAGPVGLDVLRCLQGPQLPDGVAPMALLVIRCRERDVPVFPGTDRRSDGGGSSGWI